MKRRIALCAALTLLGGCSGSGGQFSTPTMPTQDGTGAAASAERTLPDAGPAAALEQGPIGDKLVNNKIKHVVIIVQENRSLDNLFNGYPKADTVPSGSDKGTQVTLQSLPLEFPQSPGHYHRDWYASYDGGKMDGFAEAGTPKYPRLAYSFADKSETTPYWTLAQQYALGDEMFQSNTGASFASHLFLIAAQALNTGGQPGVADEPVVPHIPSPNAWGCDDAAGTTVDLIGLNGKTLPGPFPCFDPFNTLGDELDAKKLTWRYYTPAITSPNGIWSEYDAVKHIRQGADWSTKIVSPETNILTDVAGSKGTLEDVTWVIPTWKNSDHPGSGKTGPQWVASVVNAIGQSQFWDTTAIFIVWDDWGGWYDHVVPKQLDTEGLGFRVPLLVVSPYSRHGYVSHIHHEFGSILRFAEETFGLGQLAASDKRADDLQDCFNFSQTPKKFVPIPSLLRTPADFENAPAGPLGVEVEY